MKAIATKMAQVGKAVGFGVPKDGRNQSQGYDFTSAANVRMTVGPELAARKLAVSSKLELLHREAYPNHKGNRQNHIMLCVTLTFVDGDTGETMTAMGFGEGVDPGDKASAKAMTMAEKYAYVSAFTLAMGEDPERDEDTDRLGTPLSKPGVTYDDEQQARSDAQAASTAAICNGFIGMFTACTHVDDVMQLLEQHIGVIDAMGPKEISRFGKACIAHVKTGAVEGMSEIGFRESFKAVTAAHRKGGK